MTMTTSLSSPPSYFETMHFQAQDSKVRSKIYYEEFDVVSVMIHKRNQWQKWRESYGRTKGEVWLRALSGLSEARFMSPKTEI
jgi:hypothetical protein